MTRLAAALFAALLCLSGCLPPNLSQPATATAPVPAAPATAQASAVAAPAAASPLTSRPAATPTPALPPPASAQPAAATPTALAPPTSTVARLLTPSPSAPAQAQPATAKAQWIALIAYDGNVWLVDALSGARKQATQDGTGLPESSTASTTRLTNYCCLTWSSDGKLLAFRNTTAIGPAGASQWHLSVGVYDAARDETKVVLQDVWPAGLSFRPGTHLLAYDLAPDPGYFAGGKPDSSKARGIFSLDVDTGRTAELVRPEHGFSLSVPRWSPDGKLLGFLEQTAYEEPAPFALYDLEHKVYGAWNQLIGTYTFAPDGQHIAYDRLSFGGFRGDERIWVSDVWGKGERPFSPDATPMAFSPAWSPRGDMLAYLLGEPANSPGHVGNLVVQPASGGEARRLGSFGYVGPLAWSPDGTRLAFASGSQEQRTIKTVAVTDGSVKDLGPGLDPLWQPDPALAAPRPAATASSAAISLDVLRNLTYSIEDFKTRVTLKNGSSADGKLEVRLFEPVAFGDLNGDGRPDAAAILTVKSGGTGTFYDLVALLDQNGAPVQAGFAYIGDRQAVGKLEISGGHIVLDYLTQGPAAPLCCPDQHRLRSYLLENGALRLAGEQVLNNAAAQATPVPDVILIDRPLQADRLTSPQAVQGRISPVPPERKLAYYVTDMNATLLFQGEAPVKGDPGGPGTFAFDFRLGTVTPGLIQVEVVDAANGLLRGRSVVVLVAQ